MKDFATLRQSQLEAVRAFTPEAVKRLAWSKDQVREEQTARLRETLDHARRLSPYHAESLRHIDPATFQPGDLATLPIMTKSLVMENWDRLVTDPRLRLADVTAHLQRLKSGEETNPYLLNQYFACATGGSSGKRGVFLWDWETFIITANITNRMEALADAISPPGGPRRTAVITAGSYLHGSHFLFPVNLDPRREVRVFPASLSIPNLVAALNDWQPDRLVGYASIVHELCAEAVDGRLHLSLNHILTNSEPLFPEARAMAEQAWGIKIHDTWGSVEIGVAAVDGDSDTGLSLAEDFLIFEPVDAQNQPVTDLANVERLLVTKLFGPAMPMIRYEMTDALVIDDSPNPDAPGCRRIREIKGRSDAWFIYPGNIRIHPMAFRDALGQDSHISEYQVQQTADGARVLAITHGTFDPSTLTDALRRSLTTAGLSNPRITVETVQELPRHRETNKLTRFVPLPAVK